MSRRSSSVECRLNQYRPPSAGGGLRALTRVQGLEQRLGRGKHPVNSSFHWPPEALSMTASGAGTGGNPASRRLVGAVFSVQDHPKSEFYNTALTLVMRLLGETTAHA